MATFTQSDLEKVGKMLTDRYGIRVVCMGSRCSTNGNTIFLPVLPIGENAKLASLIRYYLDHECGHLVGKSNFNVLDKTCEAHGEDAALILGALEDCRVEQIMADIWVGCGVNLRVGLKELLIRLDAENASATEPLHPLKQLTVALYLCGKGIDMPKWLNQKIAGIALAHETELQEISMFAKATKDLVPMAIAIQEEFSKLCQQEGQGNGQGQPDPYQTGNANGDGGGGGDSGDGGSSGSGSSSGQDSQGDADADKKADTGSDSGDGSEGQDSQGDADADKKADTGSDSGDGSEGQQGQGAADGRVPDAAGSGGETGGTGAAAELSKLLARASKIDDSAKFDPAQETSGAVDQELEADERINGHKFGFYPRPVVPDLDKFEPFQPSNYRVLPDVDAGVNNEDSEFIKKAKMIGGPMRQKLAQLLMSEAKTWWRGGRPAGVPDPRRMAHLAAGLDNRVMRRRFEKSAPNTACYLLIDGSGSMNVKQSMKQGYSGQSRMAHAMLSAAAFTHTLALCGHDTAVGVFQYSRGTYSVRDELEAFGIKGNDLHDAACEVSGVRIHGATIYKVKTWAQQMVTALKNMSIASDMAYGGTPLGPAIVLAASDIAKRQAKRKVLMVFTDGQPDNRGYATYACKYCEKAGIEVVLVGINSNSVTGLHHKTAVVDNINNLGKTTMAELTKALHPGNATTSRR